MRTLEGRFDDMSQIQFDVLREVGNIGAGNATTALAQLIGGRVEMGVPTVELLEFKELAEVIGGAENLVVGVLLRLTGEVKGMMMFVLEKSSAKELVELLLHEDEIKEEGQEEFSEMALSVLHEIGNIIIGAYLSSLSTLTNLKIAMSVPHMAVDMAGAILSVPAIEFGKMGDKALMIESQFGKDDQLVSGYFIMIPDAKSYEKILKSLGL